MVELDGEVKPFGVVWQPPSLQTLVGVAHEMGHAFGDPHSDCGVWEKIGPEPCPDPDPVTGCVPVHDIAAYKDRYLGWMPARRKFVAPPGTDRLITLQRLAEPGYFAGATLMAEIPIDGSTGRSYTVEARRAAGYDRGIPGEAVIIQEVDPSRLDAPARIVDADGGNCGAGAMWTVGETFSDAAAGVTISVESATSTGFDVRIRVEPLPASRPR